jgi:cell division transport system permease protein
MPVEKQKFKKKKTLGSFPYLSLILSLTLALFVIGLFGLLFLHTGRLAELIKENIEIQVFLQKNLTENQRIQIEKSISAKPYTSVHEGQASITFISKEQAAEEFIKETGEDFTAILGENPLRDAFLVKLQSDYHDPEKIKAAKTDIETIPGVFEAIYTEGVIDSILKNMAKIALILLGFGFILILAVSVLINNTIKLALFSQRFLIRSMQLVGARHWFIKRPFLMRALIHGALGGLLGSVLLWVLMQYANSRIEDLSTLQDTQRIIALYGGLMVLGGLIAFFSTYRAINKYLSMSLDELY